MMSDDREFAKKVTTYLDGSAAKLKVSTVNRLQLARQQALARIDSPKTAPSLRLAGAGAGAGTGGIAGGGRSFFASGRLWLGIALLVAVGFGLQQWQAYQQLSDIEETDAALLASDLPIDAYLDRGFQNWLKRTSDEE
jgi:hypothetical protein